MKTLPLKRVALVIAGQSPPSEEVSPYDDELPFLQGNAEFGSRHPSPRLQCKSAPKVALPGDILVSVRAPVGALNVADRQYGIGRGLAAIRCNVTVEPRYVWWALNAGVDELQSRATGSTFTAVDADDLGSLPIPAVAQNEQIAIADFLDSEIATIDTAISRMRRLESLGLERRIAQIEFLVSGEQAAVGGQPSDDRYIPEGWRMVRNKTFMKEIVDLSADGDEELLTVSHITGVTPRIEKDVTMFMAESLSGYKRCQPGDLVVNTMWAWMGAAGIAWQFGIVSPAYAVYRLDRAQVDPGFIDFMIRSRLYVAKMGQWSEGVWTSRLRLYPEVLLAMTTLVPPLSAQREILDKAARLSKHASQLASKIRMLVAVLQERRQVLITTAITGQIPIPGAA